MQTPPERRAPRRRWRWWLFIGLNVAGLLLILPLLKITWPLLQIWWTSLGQAEEIREPAVRLTEVSATQNGQFSPPSNGVDAPAQTDTNTSLEALTNQLGALEGLSDSDLKEIVARNFGVHTDAAADSKGFDMDSAVFDQISRTNVVYEGQKYVGYKVVLVDRNGLFQTNIDCFAQPNPDYERSLATMELINRSPQLKRIYDAMAGSLADKARDTNSEPAHTEDEPTLPER